MIRFSKKNVLCKLGLSLIIIANVCFYNMNAITYYLYINIAASFLIIFDYILSNGFNIKLIFSPCIKWLTIVYTLFMLYGFFWLRIGKFNWDFRIFTYCLCIIIYLAYKKLFVDGKWISNTVAPITCSLIFILIYMFINRSSVIRDDGRIGDYLSGNVNTVCVCLGILSYFLVQVTYNKKKMIYSIVFFFSVIAMLFTGSKKAIFILIIDFIYANKLANGNVLSKSFILFIAIIVLIIIIRILAIYNIIGYRIRIFIITFFSNGNREDSFSTTTRLKMIYDGFKIFLTRPLFGGGTNYFALMSNYGKDSYSHCNYIEMLCSYGIFGTFLFYFPFFRNLKLITMIKNNEVCNFGKYYLALSLILGWMMVNFSGLCIDYIPIIVSFVIIENYEIGNRYTKK